MSEWISIAISIFFGAATLCITVAKLKEDERARVFQTLGHWSAKTRRVIKAIFYVVGLINSAIGIALILLQSSPNISRGDLSAAILHMSAIVLLLGDLLLTRIFKQLAEQESEIQALKKLVVDIQQAPQTIHFSQAETQDLHHIQPEFSP